MSKTDIAKLKILIVEDNIHFRTLVRSILETLGVKNIEEARDGNEAVDVLKNFTADIVILDWKMDGMDGIECVKQIRAGKDKATKFLPVILCSGFTEERLKREALDAGANAFLPKPISSKSLLSRIISIMEEKPAFVDSRSYFGPDRRQSSHDFDGPNRRKTQAKLITADGDE